MKLEVLASGSGGNVTAVYTGAIILLDCGKAANWTLSKLNYRLPTAILVTHEHGDHSKAVTDFLKRGVDIYMTRGTIEALKLRKRHNLHAVAVGEEFLIGSVRAMAIPSIHDAAEPVNFILSGKSARILYVTDTGAMPPITGKFTDILIEANYSEPVLLASDLAEGQKRRILENHLSAEQAIKFLTGQESASVHLIHISKRHGDTTDFVERVKSATGNDNVRCS